MYLIRYIIRERVLQTCYPSRFQNNWMSPRPSCQNAVLLIAKPERKRFPKSRLADMKQVLKAYSTQKVSRAIDVTLLARHKKEARDKGEILLMTGHSLGGW